MLISIWEEVKTLNKRINEVAPWDKSPKERHDFLIESLSLLQEVGQRLGPFLPQTSGTIIERTSGIIKKGPPLFPRLSK